MLQSRAHSDDEALAAVAKRAESHVAEAKAKSKKSHQKDSASKVTPAPVVLYENNESENYADRPGSHPYLNSGIRLKWALENRTAAERIDRVFRPRAFPTPAEERSALFGLGPPANAEELPLSWAPAPKSVSDPAWKAPESMRVARETIVIYVPIEELPSTDTMHFADIRKHERQFMAAFHFINKAICTRKVGSIDAEGTTHRFKNEFGQSLPKIEVVGEVLLHDINGVYNKHMMKHYKNVTRTEEIMARAAADVQLREKLLARANIKGIRFFVFIIDPKLDSGRAVQKRLFRNQVETGEFSAVEVVEREERWQKARNQRLNLWTSLSKELDTTNAERQKQGLPKMLMSEFSALKKKPADAVMTDEAAQVAAPPEELLQQAVNEDNINSANADEGIQHEDVAVDPEAQERKRKEKMDALVNERYAAEVRGDKGEVSAIDAKIAKLASAQERGPSRQQTTEAQVEAARKLGLKFDAQHVGSRYPAILFQLKDQRGKFDNSTAFGAASTKRFDVRGQRKMSDDERKRYAETASGRTVSVVSITRMRDVMLALASLLNITSKQPSKGPGVDRINHLKNAFYRNENLMMDESTDLHPNPESPHPYKPSNWLTFENMTVGWNLDGQVCPEQLNPANYYDAHTKEFVVPFPCLAWRLPSEKGFKSKVLAKTRPFWIFGSLYELMAECKRKYERRMLEETAEAHKETDSHKATEEVMSHLFKDAKRRRAIIEEEEKTRKEYEASVLVKDQRAYEKKYPRSASSVISESDRGFSSGGAPDPSAIADKEKQEVLVRDIIGDAVEDAAKQYQKVKDMIKKCPEDEQALVRAYRKHQESVFFALMRPDADKLYPNNKYGMNMVHSQHVKALFEGNPLNPKIYFKFTGYQNLTFNASLMAEWINRMNTIVGITNSIHVLACMFWQMNANAYDSHRAHGIHVIKIGAPGCGKSFMDAILKKLKLDGTVEDAIHMSEKSKLTEVSQDDRILIKDEADKAIMGDNAKNTTTQDYNASMLTKAYLGSSGTMGFSVFGLNAEGVRVSIYKQVGVRSNMTMSSNIYNPAKDGSIYDRLMRFIIVPTTKPMDASMEIVKKALDPSLGEAASELIREELRGLDLLQFRGEKMIAVGAAAKPNINDTLLHILKGIPKLEKYGISADTSMRRVTVMMELAKSLTVTMAIMRTFTNGPTVRRIGDSTETRAWVESMMREVKYQLFATQDITTYVLSQGFRQIIGDYEGFDVLFCIAKMQLGHRDDIFHDLFEREAYEQKQVTDPKTGKKIMVRGKKRFPFLRFESLHGKNRLPSELPQYVKDEEIKMRQWEAAGWRARKPKGSDDLDDIKGLRFYPSFLCWKEGSGGLTAEENQAKSDAIKSGFKDPLKTASKAVFQPKGARQGTVTGAPPSMANADPDAKKDEVAAEEAAATNSVGGRPAPGATEVRVIDPNWIIHPKLGTKEAIQAAVRDRSACSFSTDQMAEYSVRHMCQDRKMLVPVLEWITDADEDLHFVKHKVGGREVIQMRMTPFCCVMNIKTESVDCWTGRTIPPGDHFAISTMAIYMFRPMALLFKFLTSLEYEFTPKQTMIIDVPVPGHEGVHYTHTSHPKPGRHMSRSSSNIVTNSFMQTYLLEHSRTQYNLFVDKTNLDSIENEEANKEIFNKIYEDQQRDMDLAKNIASRPEIRKELAGLMEDDDEDDKITNEEHPHVSKKSAHHIDEDDSDAEGKAGGGVAGASIASVPGSSAATAGTVAQPLRRHIPAGFDNDHISRQAMRMVAGAKRYTRYHVFEEFEKWLVEEYGKNIHKEGKPITEKIYYPHAGDARMELAVSCAPQYQLTRALFKGRRVYYPDDIVKDEKLLREQQAPRSYQTSGTDYTQISSKECDDISERIMRMLEVQRRWAAERLDRKKKFSEPSDAVAKALSVKAKEQQKKTMEEGKTMGPPNSTYLALGITKDLNDKINKHTEEKAVSLLLAGEENRHEGVDSTLVTKTLARTTEEVESSEEEDDDDDGSSSSSSSSSSSEDSGSDDDKRKLKRKKKKNNDAARALQARKKKLRAKKEEAVAKKKKKKKNAKKHGGTATVAVFTEVDETHAPPAVASATTASTNGMEGVTSTGITGRRK